MNIAVFSCERQGEQVADGAIALLVHPMIMGGSYKEGNTENRYTQYCNTYPHRLPFPGIDGCIMRVIVVRDSAVSIHGVLNKANRHWEYISASIRLQHFFC